MTPSWFDWKSSTSIPRSLPCDLADVTTSDRVVLPYTAGSRVPRRFRLGPLMRRMVLLIVIEMEFVRMYGIVICDVVICDVEI